MDSFFFIFYIILLIYKNDKEFKNNIENGLDMIKQSLLSCPKTPGVYILVIIMKYYTLEKQKIYLKGLNLI